MKAKKHITAKAVKTTAVPVKRPSGHPLVSLQNEINRAFDGFFGFSPALTGVMPEKDLMPKINVSESTKEITVSAELPGLDEKNIDVSLSRGILTIKGEKKTEKEEKDKNYYYMERSSGSFYREIPVPEGADADQAKAGFKNGVLTVNIPKLPAAHRAGKSIPVKSG